MLGTAELILLSVFCLNVIQATIILAGHFYYRKKKEGHIIDTKD